MEHKKKYNKLTEKLLSDGYTPDEHPPFVIVDNSKLTGDDPLNNLAGGFAYRSYYVESFTYKTGCGLYVKGGNVMPNMSYMGIDWTHENDCPVIRCPYDKVRCPQNNELLHGDHGGGLCFQCFCACHRTDEEYDYENSFENAEKLRREEIEKRYEEYVRLHKGRVCRNHMFYNERTGEWNQEYDPSICASQCESQDGFCPILGRVLSKKRGNVYYDLKTSYIRDDGTLFSGEKITHIEKGIRFFKRPASMDICEAFLKTGGKDRIWNTIKWNGYTTEKMFHPTLEKVVCNVRAESKPSRDLLQDLEDIKAGVSISFYEDVEKAAKEKKKASKKRSQEQRIRLLEKKILEKGYESFEEFSLDKVHADKWLGMERIEELETMRQKMIKEKENQPKQMSLFDFPEVTS